MPPGGGPQRFLQHKLRCVHLIQFNQTL
jgi:hypothetical protein